MSIGKVTTWQMSEEERLAYIEKHPIVPTEKPVGVEFSRLNLESVKNSPRSTGKPKIMDSVDQKELHRRFMNGESMDDIARSLDVSAHTLQKFISDQRQRDPEKWPRRVMGRKKQNEGEVNL